MVWQNLKPFEQDLHDKFDPSGKTAVINFLVNKGIEAVENPDKYGIDILVLRDGEIIGSAEVEVRNYNHQDKSICPYNTIHVPVRKEKFRSSSSLFFSVTPDLEHAYVIVSSEIDGDKKEVPNCKVANGEYFYDIPKDKFKYIRLV